jgi:hypothetical protein
VGGGGNPMEARGVVSMEPTVGSKSLVTAFFVVNVQGNYSVILVAIGFMPIIVFPLLCTNS